MSEVLYRKYRPLDFDEVVGQQHVVKTIQNAVKRGKIAHAYLFSGPRGVGKTTVARILAKTANCENVKNVEPCNKCKVCLSVNEGKFLDMVEIDAATHTQVDKMRDIIEKINLSPSSGKYKVYIIDEVHMLSKGAFNALLKTLEEPPRHAIFILATTEIHKIPATIISRCQKFDFKRIKVSEIIKRLEKIAGKEKIKVEKGVLDLVAINSSGCLRDGESLFGQILSLEEDNFVTLKEVQSILALADISLTVKMANFLLDKEYGKAIDYINEIVNDGYDLEQFAKSLVEYFRKLVLLKVSLKMKESFSSEMTEEQIKELESISQKASVSRIVKIIRAILRGQEEIKSSIIPQLSMELAIVEIELADENQLANKTNNDYNVKIKEPIKKITDTVSRSVKQSQDFIKKSIGMGKDVKESGIDGVEAENKDVKMSGESVVILETVKKNWYDILEKIKPHNHSLTAFLKVCLPVGMEKNKIIVSCRYSFHKDKLQKVESREIIENVMEKVLKTKMSLEFVTEEEAEKFGYKIEKIKPEKDRGEKGSLIESALEMFGGEIV